MEEFRALAAERLERPRSLAAAVVILIVWLAAGVGAGFWLWRRLGPAS
jgi:hypothetical protein